MPTLEEQILTPPVSPDFLPVADSDFRQYITYGLADTARTYGAGAGIPNGDFAVVEDLEVRRDGVAAPDGLFIGDSLVITWQYPSLTRTPKLGTQTITPIYASVSYEVRLLEGTFSLADINSLSVFGLSATQSSQLNDAESLDFLTLGSAFGYLTNRSTQTFPGRVVFEQTQDRSLANGPIFLNVETPPREFVSIPNSAIGGARDYTVVVRHLLHDRSVGFRTPSVPIRPYALSQYAVYNFRINSAPTVSNLRVNGAKDPVLTQASDITFSFDASDTDGPGLTYELQIGTLAGTSFVPNIFTTGDVQSSQSRSSRISISHQYAGPTLAPSVDYYWRVIVSDGLEEGQASSANDKFRLNSRPVITSLKVGGNEMLISNSELSVNSENLAIEWEFEDEDGDPQRAYELVLKRGGQEFLNTGTVSSDAQSVTIPSLPAGERMQISLRIKDPYEFSTPATATFGTNSPPSVVDLLVEGDVNPGDLATATPTFSWRFVDPEGDIQSSYRIQVATDADFSDLVWDTGTKTGATSSVVYGSVASPAVAPAALVHDQLYHVRVQGSDETSASEYATGFFAVNTAPGAPTLIAPSAGSYDGPTLTVQWVEASPLDDDGDDVTYTLEITEESSFNRGWKFLAGPFESGTTSYDLDISTIPAGDNYGIRIIASDGFAESNPASGGTSPRFTINNHAPTPPAFVRPKAGDEASRVLRVEWVEADVVDVDGDSVQYELQLTKDSSASTVIWEAIATVPQGETRLFLDVSELPDGDNYRLRVRAIDAPGAASSFVMSGVFSVQNTVAIKDFERLGGILYLGSTDGRIFRAQDTIWQIDEDWSDQRGRAPFEIFVRGEPKAEIANGKLVISPVPESTYLLRHSDDPSKK